MYTLSIRDGKSIRFTKHDTWDDAYDEMMAFGKWRYVGCFGTGICEYELGGYVAHLYRK